MTRSELIEILWEKMPQLSYSMVEEVVKKIFELLADSLCKGDRIEIRGFGSFSLRFRSARIARNPKTGEKVAAESRGYMHFKPGKEMRDRVNHIESTS